MDAAYGVVAALFDRERTGTGHQIDVSLTDSMTRFLTPKLVAYLGSGEAQRRSGGRDSVIAIYQVFETTDEPLTLALGNDAIFQRFCNAIGRRDLADDPANASNRDRRARRVELVEEIQAVLRSGTRAHWLALCAKADVPAGPINRVDEVVMDEHLRARRLFYRTSSNPAVPQVNTGWHLDGEPNGYRWAPPGCGAHNDEVLTEWGIGEGST
jgi:crotonobetainyl-CoA:carnitine CoA-transferase CaiB-like acyl-CoA transferase